MYTPKIFDASLHCVCPRTLLSPLEVEELETHDTDEPEECREAAEDPDNDAQIVLLVPKVPAATYTYFRSVCKV